MRKLARSVARASSYRKTRTTDLFHQEFERIWRLNGRHPQFSAPWNATKRHVMGVRKRGHILIPLMETLKRIKDKLLG